MRLRTLPLSLAGIVTGVTLASPVSTVSGWAVASVFLTAALLQILSNLSNELGDTLHGTDNADARQGAHYSIMDGEMTVEEMKRLIAAIAVLCCLSGLGMVILSFGTVFAALPIAFLGLGAAAIWAAMHYTLGDKPYGYRGLGDIFVFVFFGLATTLGGAFLSAHTLQPLWILPAVGIGLFSVGVLNVNNIRDMKTDAATRRTVALRMGPKRARIYQTALIAGGWAAFLTYTAATFSSPADLLYILSLPLFVVHLRGVWTREGRDLDGMLPLLVLGTFALSLLF